MSHRLDDDLVTRIVRIDMVRPGLVLTRAEVCQARTLVTVAAITSTVFHAFGLDW